jgi:NADH-quinone oxidoreductase subunit H
MYFLIGVWGGPRRKYAAIKFFVYTNVASLIMVVGVFAPVLVWAERRQSAMMQDRVGPVRAGFKIFGREIRLLGLLHPLADALKMIWKEDFVPPRADRFLHAIAPMLPVATGVAAFVVVGDEELTTDLEAGLRQIE